MAKKIILEFTERQMLAFIDILDTNEAMIGGSELLPDGSSWDGIMDKNLKLMDKMLKKNGYRRTSGSTNNE